MALFAGLALLSQQYEWARRRVEPVKQAAFKASAESVQSLPRILLTLLGVLANRYGLAWCGASVRQRPAGGRCARAGGCSAAGTMIFSGVVALALMVYNWHRFGGDREASPS